MTKIRFVAQIKTKNGWFDEFWTYDPFEFYTGFDHFKLLAPNMWRGVLRIVETEFFEHHTDITKKHSRGKYSLVFSPDFLLTSLLYGQKNELDVLSKKANIAGSTRFLLIPGKFMNSIKNWLRNNLTCVFLSCKYNIYLIFNN